MSRPKNDGRTRIERCREAAKLGGHAAHERSGELVAALRASMVVVDAVLSGDAARIAAARSWLGEPVHTTEDWPGGW